MNELSDWQIYTILFTAAFVAGGVNTLAGSGSLITLPLLIFLGLPANIANGTNRIGVIAQSTVGAFSFRKLNEFALQDSLWIIVPSCTGSICGGLVAARLNEHIMNMLIGAIMIFMLLVIILNPDKWLRETSESNTRHKTWWMVTTMLLIGFYGGFIQAGVGILMLAAFVLIGRYQLRHANALKLFNALVFTIPPVVIFIINRQVVWSYAMVMIPAQALGAFAAARFAKRHPRSDIWVRRLLITIVSITIIKYFNLHRYIFD
jgi:hypothetical protein